MKMFAEEPV